MKRVLIIAYHFPPSSYVHSLRPIGLAKYFPNFNWEPIILTSQSKSHLREILKSKFKIYETPPFDINMFLRGMFGLSVSTSSSNYNNPAQEKRLHRFMKFQLKKMLAFPDRHNGWFFRTIKTAEQIIHNHKIDCILSTSMPWTSALIARRLKVKYKIPWIADAGDLWTQYHRYSYGSIRRFFETFLEKWTLKEADVLVMVSEERAAKWRMIHPDKKIVPIVFGFDPDDFKNPQKRLKSKKFTITYAGKISEKQSPELLFKAIAELVKERKIKRDIIEVNFWGFTPLWVRKLSFKYEIDDIIKFNEYIPREKIIPKLMESQLLLLLNWNDPNEKGVHPGKLFDYLGARRPILAIGEHRDVVTDVLERTNAGVQVFDLNTLKTFLEQMIKSFELTSETQYLGIDREIEDYSFPIITEKFSKIMDLLININSR